MTPFGQSNSGLVTLPTQLGHSQPEPGQSARKPPEPSLPTLGQAESLYRSGDAAQAAELCRVLVEADPNDADAWHQLGLAEAALGQMPAAIAHFEQAVALRPLAPTFRSNLALACGMAGDWARAAAEYRRAVEIRPGHAASLAKLGRALARTGLLGDAIGWLERAVDRAPNADNWNALGATLAQAGRLEQAAVSLGAALEADASHEEARGNLEQLARLALRRGASHAENEGWSEAAADFELACRANPRSDEAHFHAGLAHSALGDLPQARRSYQAAATLRPGYAEAWNNWAHVELALGDTVRALELARRATTERPAYTDAHYNMGVILQELDQPEQAAASYRRVLVLDPARADAHNNLGSLALGRNHWPQAIESFDRAIAISPGHIDARWNRALALLMLGCWRDGWQAYEARLEREEYRARHFAARRWQGEDLTGRSILIWAEQGLGDTIQFLRLLPTVAARASSVWIECQPRLKPLLACAGLNVIGKGEPLPATDFEVPLISLPWLTGLEPDTVPPPFSDYRLPEERLASWRALIGDAETELRVGLVWGAQAANVAGRSRSMKLTALEPLSQLAGVRLISLQHGAQASELAGCAWVERFDEPVGDILDTAALMSNLDLVITVDTMTAHLAGSLGVPVWTMLPFAADWRWLQTGEPQAAESVGGTPTIWYPSMRLFRQPRRGDWPGLVEQVRQALAQVVRDCPRAVLKS